MNTQRQRKRFLAVSGVGLLTLLLAGCGTTGTQAATPPTAKPAAHRTGGAPSIGWKGTITMFAQAYTPHVPGLTLPYGTGNSKLTMFEAAAKSFEKLYPGIHIKFVYPAAANTGNPQWYETRAAAGQLPDVLWSPYVNNNNVLPHGIFTNLAPYFRQPNPYISGNKAWQDVMNPNVLKMVQAPNGSQYQVDGDWVGTSFYYNKDMFAKAGIRSTPKTWGQLIQDVKTLQAHHIVPGANIPNYGWYSRLFLGNYLGQSTLQKLASYTPHSSGVITSYDEVMGYHAGILNPATNPRIMAWWPVMKELYNYWDKNVTNVSAINPPTGAPSGESTFAAGKIAMTYQGSWTPNTLQGPPPVKFHYGSFNFPSLKGSSPYATNLDSSGAVGGPSAAFSYSIPTQRADSTMTSAKFQAVLDWVRFFSTPHWDQAIVNQLGSFVPTFKGTKPLPVNASLAAQIQKPFYVCFGFSDLSPEASNRITQLFQEYVSGHISFSLAKQQYDSIVQQAVQQYVITNHVHF